MKINQREKAAIKLDSEFILLFPYLSCIGATPSGKSLVSDIIWPIILFSQNHLLLMICIHISKRLHRTNFGTSCTSHTSQNMDRFSKKVRTSQKQVALLYLLLWSAPCFVNCNVFLRSVKFTVMQPFSKCTCNRYSILGETARPRQADTSLRGYNFK